MKVIEKEEVFDSPRGFVSAHIKEFDESGGKKGSVWLGAPALLLVTRGRKTGKLRRTGLIYGRDGKNYLLVASAGGAPKHPLWYLNLVQNPEVELQVGADKIKGRARTASKEEKPRLWKIMAGLFPRYDEYKTKTSREIPLIIVEPV
jgi:deazaflavin-dependent oxidoreductase (nitroreductase family)